MKDLILKDGKTLKCVDSSTRTDIVLVLSKFSELDGIEFTPGNIEGATLDGESLDVKYMGFVAKYVEGGTVEAHITCREKTKEEKTDEAIEDLTVIVSSFLMGGM